MAKNYHPLDTRYKGPSTAYTGSAKRKDVGAPVTPAPQPQASPWGKPAQKLQHAPPPLPPLPRQQTPKPRRSGMRILFGLLVVIIVVGINIYATRSTTSLIHQIETEMNAITF